ncbi:histone deacetylase family protein [Allopusillimonas soli]|uniref:Histone deacetylase family protein n=1 Tax=Allopusillimonas soli TaxID=659016 RepID=A0A853FJT8_9BURK|nr:histone deacetylase family protein [Allopusillimonas soli]NYT39000.1 histone deacetylase family protein [Allopusillimonas soli]TEA69559.1 histone deacetylase family protein [Allopusillimonas soli]
MRAYFAPEQLKHDPKQFMWEGRIVDPKDVKERTDALLRALAALNIPVYAPDDFDLSPLQAVHAQGYLDFLQHAYEHWQTLRNPGIEVLPSHSPYYNGRIEQLSRPECPSTSPVARAGYYLGDLSSPMGPHTWESSLRSAHSAVAAARAVLAGDQAAYALCRPSGHHVRHDCAAGFCYLNNGAIAVQQLRERFSRVAVLDIDVHHGDGTQQIFYGRSDVLTVSLHADPIDYYPFFTGYTHETGYGEGEGYNLNLPMPRGSTDDAWLQQFQIACERIADFRPQALMIALGFDAHVDDPLGVLSLSDDCFRKVGASIAALGLPTVLVQEGGYAVDVIGASLQAFLEGFLGRKAAPFAAIP